MRHKGLSFRKKKKIKISFAGIKVLLGYLVWVVIAAFIGIVLSVSFGMRTNVVGNSMKPGLESGQQILIDRFIFGLSSPKSGDVIAFLPNGNENSHYYIKRVIGVPGNIVLIDDGIIYINGEPYSNGVDYDKIKDAGIAENPILLGEDEYFVMGDNCNDSEDSRSANIGKVKSSYIVGKVWFKLSKNLEKIGFVK